MTLVRLGVGLGPITGAWPRAPTRRSGRLQGLSTARGTSVLVRVLWLSDDQAGRPDSEDVTNGEEGVRNYHESHSW